MGVKEESGTYPAWRKRARDVKMGLPAIAKKTGGLLLLLFCVVAVVARVGRWCELSLAGAN